MKNQQHKIGLIREIHSMAVLDLQWLSLVEAPLSKSQSEVKRINHDAEIRMQGTYVEVDEAQIPGLLVDLWDEAQGTNQAGEGPGGSLAEVELNNSGASRLKTGK